MFTIGRRVFDKYLSFPHDETVQYQKNCINIFRVMATDFF